VQRLRRAADLLDDRHHGRPAGRMIAFMVKHHPYRPIAHLRRKLVRRFARHGPFLSGVGASSRPGAVHIYQSLFVQGRGALRRELTACLRCGRALRMPRARTRGRGKTFISPKIMISKRPAEAADRAGPLGRGSHPGPWRFRDWHPSGPHDALHSAAAPTADDHKKTPAETGCPDQTTISFATTAWIRPPRDLGRSTRRTTYPQILIHLRDTTLQGDRWLDQRPFLVVRSLG
jgi:hypothetical protein